MALSAFYLSTLPTPLARKAIVKEMWQSGAEVIVSGPIHGSVPWVIEESRFSLIMTHVRVARVS